MRYYLSSIIRVSLFFLLAFLSVVMIYTSHQNSQAVRSLARTSLESTALALSMAAENALRRSGTGRDTEIRDILSDRVVAYALIARHDDTILFHTNPTLVGTKLHDNEVKQQLAKGNVSSREITLGTGIPAYEFNFTLHHPDGSEELLRLILHTSQADLIVSRAERMWWLVGIMLTLLWTAGLLLERTATRYIRLQAQQEEQKRLTLIGQMTAVLAHEIRNALASIKGYAQWVNEKTAESEPSKPAMGAILQGTGRIESLVNEILLFSKQETYTIEPVGIAPLMDEAAGSGLTGWQGKTEIEIDPGILVMADREKLLRTLVNGMRNAVDAMGGDGVLHIGVSAEGRWVTLRIEDSGPGISAEEVPRLFTPFYTTKTEGTGLGLAYAKKVVEGMGGIINLENRKYKQGAILSIKLPAS